MYEVTKSRLVTGPIAIWAIPQRTYSDGEWQLTGEWEYELKDHDPYQTGAIKLQEHEVTLTLSEGLPFIEKAVETLDLQIKEERAESFKKIQRLKHMKEKLQLITHQKEPYVAS